MLMGIPPQKEILKGESIQMVKKYNQRYDRTVAVTCIQCGKIIPTKMASLRYCNYECKRKLFKQTKPYYYQSYFRPSAYGKTVAVSCINCGDIVITNHSNKKFCKPCGDESRRIHSNAQQKRYLKAHPEKGHEYSMRYRGTGEIVAITCSICGELMVSSNMRRKVCPICSSYSNRQMPRYIKQRLLHFNRNLEMPLDLKRWELTRRIREVSDGQQYRY